MDNNKWHEKQVELVKIEHAEHQLILHVLKSLDSFAPTGEIKLSKMQRYKILAFYFTKQLYKTIF